MAKSNSESRFYESLKDIFIGAKVEGVSGYINLMRIKSRYFDKIFALLKEEIEEKLKEFPEFKEELYNKLYSFFKRYFSESGSLYFVSTPFDERIYERVYTDREDASLFWKTHMLYYVKTDRIFNSITIETDGFNFFFDVSKLEYKRAWEKREIIYELKEVRRDGTISFYVMYSERGRKTKLNEIVKKLKEKGIKLDEEVLEKAFRIFEKQSEVDYFINKNANKFLKEQFDLWLYQYEFSDKSEFTEKRIKQLKVLQEIAYKIIDFISQFEDELVRIWNKPKFVLDSNYVITLDRMAKKPEGIKLIEEILKHNNFEQQVKEWKELGIVGKDFKTKDFFTNTLNGEVLNPKYNFLPIDTKHFKDLELEILSLFDNLDEALDGWLIKSENYQALNTILPKFKGKVQTIYIDPPFNKEQDADYFYNVKFKDATWITMLENRLRLAREILKDAGTIYVKCDYNGSMYVRLLMNEIFEKENFRSEVIWKRFTGTKIQYQSFAIVTDTIYTYSKSSDWIYNQQYRSYSEKYISSQFKYEDNRGKYLLRNFYSLGAGPARKFFGKLIEPPKGHHWRIKQEKIDQLIKEERIVLDKGGFPKLKMYLNEMKGNPYNNLLDEFHVVQGSSSEFWGFATQNPESLLKLFVLSSSNEGDLIMDFFLGSGTTTAVAHKLGRKWLGVEMGDHFFSVVLPRMKKVLAYDKSGISKEDDVKERYNENKAGGFFKYFELEQFEQTLRNVRYEDSDTFLVLEEDPYNQYIFMRDLKLLESLEIDYNKNKVKVDLSKLYKNIDIVETLSCLLGKLIKKITVDEVEFEDGEKVNLKDLNYKIVKPLIWWRA